MTRQLFSQAVIFIVLLALTHPVGAGKGGGGRGSGDGGGRRAGATPSTSTATTSSNASLSSPRSHRAGRDGGTLSTFSSLSRDRSGTGMRNRFGGDSTLSPLPPLASPLSLPFATRQERRGLERFGSPPDVPSPLSSPLNLREQRRNFRNDADNDSPLDSLRRQRNDTHQNVNKDPQNVGLRPGASPTPPPLPRDKDRVEFFGRHEGFHAGTHDGFHLGWHRGRHEDDVNGLHQGRHFGPHDFAHNDFHDGTHVGTFRRNDGSVARGPGSPPRVIVRPRTPTVIIQPSPIVVNPFSSAVIATTPPFSSAAFITTSPFSSAVFITTSPFFGASRFSLFSPFVCTPTFGFFPSRFSTFSIGGTFGRFGFGATFGNVGFNDFHQTTIITTPFFTQRPLAPLVDLPEQEPLIVERNDAQVDALKTPLEPPAPVPTVYTPAEDPNVTIEAEGDDLRLRWTGETDDVVWVDFVLGDTLKDALDRKRLDTMPFAVYFKAPRRLAYIGVIVHFTDGSETETWVPYPLPQK